MLVRSASKQRPQLERFCLPFLYSTLTIRRELTVIDRGSKQDSEPPRFRRVEVGDQDRRGTRTAGRTANQRHRKTSEVTARSNERSRASRFNDRFVKKNEQLERFETKRPREEHIPFDRRSPEQLSDGADKNDLTKTTITPREKKAFERLLKLLPSKEKETSPRSPSEVGNGANAAPLCEAQEDDITRDAAVPQFSSPVLQQLASSAMGHQKAQDDTKSTEETITPISREAQESIADIEQKFHRAKSDEELWQRLNTYILDPVGVLNLDGAKHSARRPPKSSKKTTPPAIETTSITPELLTEHLHRYLLAYMRESAQSFPSSLRPLSLLSCLRNLGPSTLALGASTELYNAHMSALYAHYPTDLGAITDILAEMDHQAYSFDDETLRLLARIDSEAWRFQRGHGGKGMQALWTTERMWRGVKAIKRWRAVVIERMQEEALRLAQSEIGA
ncbi:Hypothetical protein R9X50_00336000 [Acrodontium crateriforme]|uniref:Mtf2-like C-terminal domain-containing protein n=1 Tax=Acrodontium crateriforme TaxID=150365 RepID=A0AAQ3R465_9PEZI|nr:Hypothetical protein R9X50_00336000 [Acrodontium crateriforme]